MAMFWLREALKHHNLPAEPFNDYGCHMLQSCITSWLDTENVCYV